ncbi:MAG: hypothetical protein ACUZ8N_10855 [Candidatus Scalindua sp.]
MKISEIKPEEYVFEIILTKSEKNQLVSDLTDMNFTVSSHNLLHKFWNLLK